MGKSRGSFQRKAVEIYTPERAAYEMRQGRDIRAEYNTLRKRAQERLRELKSAGRENLEVYRDYVNRFPTLTEIGKGQYQDKQLLADAYAEVTRFLNMRQSTVGGYRASVEQAAATFEKHYGDELPHMDYELVGEMMRAIKDSERGKAYYHNWKKTYRGVLGNAEKYFLSDKEAKTLDAKDRSELAQSRLLEAVKSGDISIGPKGGLVDESTGRHIAGKWAGMGL